LFQRMMLDRITAAGLPTPGLERENAGGTAAAAKVVAEADKAKTKETVDALLAELDELVGLADVKHEIRLTAALARVEQLRKERGLPVLDRSRHLVFTGNPGTGKTTVARLLARIYCALGVVEGGQLI